jgi:hypothetical protein
MAQSYELAVQAKMVMELLKDDKPHLVGRLDEYFPHTQAYAWLEEYDETLGTVFWFDSEGGWLDGQTNLQFWQLVEEGYATRGTDRIGSCLDQLAAWLDGLLTQWDTAVAANQNADAVAPDPTAARFEQIERVDGYPDWWQGYDTCDGVWKYMQGAQQPDDGTHGWAVSAVAFPSMQAQPEPAQPAAAAARFEQIGRVEGHPDWWLGFDTRERVWRYVQSPRQPDDETPGWAVSTIAFPLMLAAAAHSEVDESFEVDELDFAALYGEGVTGAIEAARAAGLDPERYPDEAVEAAFFARFETGLSLAAAL